MELMGPMGCSRLRHRRIFPIFLPSQVRSFPLHQQKYPPLTLRSCLSARRRKRQGQQPYYGTGWVGRTPFGHGQATYNPNVATQQPQQEVYGNGINQQYNSPPAYGQQGAASGYYSDQNRGYFGGQQTEHEMQPPQAVYGNPYQPDRKSVV